MTILEIVTLMITHVIFDWWLQPRVIAENKSTNNYYLITHLVILTIGLLVWSGVFSRLDLTSSFWWAILNVASHGFVDKYLIGFYKRAVMKRLEREESELSEYKYWKDKTFYDTIALDQLIHGVLYILFYCLLI